jgi:hypothetical protein
VTVLECICLHAHVHVSIFLEMQLSAEPVDALTDLSSNEMLRFPQGLVQQESIHFTLPDAVEGLRCTKKYTVGELSWDQTVMMGSFEAGEHEYNFSESAVPTGNLTRGKYQMQTVFMDVHGQYLWAGLNQFEVVAADAAASLDGPL